MFNINREYYSHKICGILWKKKNKLLQAHTKNVIHHGALNDDTHFGRREKNVYINNNANDNVKYIIILLSVSVQSITNVTLLLYLCTGRELFRRRAVCFTIKFSRGELSRRNIGKIRLNAPSVYSNNSGRKWTNYGRVF